VEMYSQHVKHAGTKGVWRHFHTHTLPEIYAKILQFRGISTHYTTPKIRYSSSACVNGKVVVGSDNHMHNYYILSQGWNMGE